MSRRFYAIQHDRFRAEDISSHLILPFPARRSQQVAQQTAYNQEVSIMAGISKHVGFPAAPSLSSARPSEIDDDLGKMGVGLGLLFLLSDILLPFSRTRKSAQSHIRE